MFSREFIESLVPKVKKVDSNDQLDLFCYTSCSNNDDETIQSCRGLVFHKDQLVLKAFPYTPDYTIEDLDVLEKKYPNIQDYLFFDSYEGTLLRVFYHDKWYISTHRRLDAFKSRWASKYSFGELFEQALNYRKEMSSDYYSFLYASSEEETKSSTLDVFLSKLEKDKQYMFLLQNNRENRIVCNAPEYPKIFHVGTFQNGKVDTCTDINIQYPPEVKFQSWNDLKIYVENVNHKSFQGVIMYNGVEQVKILNSTYKKLFDLRGNDMSIKNRYLYIRMNSEQKKTYMELYPDYKNYFNEYEKAIHEIGIQIFNAYINRFIHKQHVVLFPEEYHVLKECHAWHITNRLRNRVSMNKVFETLNKQEPFRINKMIKRYLNVEDKKNTIINSEGLRKVKTNE